MKLNFAKKLFAILTLGLGLFTLGACQSTGSDASVDIKNSAVQVLKTTGGDTLGRVTIYVRNNTIYNTKGFLIAYNSYDSLDQSAAPVVQELFELPLIVRHGASGLLYNEVAIQDPSIVRIDIVASNTAGETKCTGFYNIWETYLGWWIVGIVVVAIAWLAFGVTIFGKGVTAEQAKDEFQKHLATILISSCLFLVICLFPLIMGSWFPTIILLGTLALVIGGQAALTGIKALADRK